VQRALTTADELAWKLLRNLAVAGGQLLAPCLLSHADGMLNILQVRTGHVLCWPARCVVRSCGRGRARAGGRGGVGCQLAYSCCEVRLYQGAKAGASSTVAAGTCRRHDDCFAGVSCGCWGGLAPQ
jgi:hypothetical protein